MTSEKIDVLDKGYVRLIDYMGSDLSVVNAARASFAKESAEMTPGDARLINFLVKNDHMSPFRHAMVSLEFKAPLMVARQHWKYVVGSDHTQDGWNEASRRYVTADEEFYVVANDAWRSTPEDKKQGSGEPLPTDIGDVWTEALEDFLEVGLTLYKDAMAAGICAEQARLFLPAYGLYVNYRWTASLQSVIHFIKQRVAHDAQKEITDYAHATYNLIKPLFPVTFESFSL